MNLTEGKGYKCTNSNTTFVKLTGNAVSHGDRHGTWQGRLNKLQNESRTDQICRGKTWTNQNLRVQELNNKVSNVQKLCQGANTMSKYAEKLPFYFEILTFFSNTCFKVTEQIFRNIQQCVFTQIYSELQNCNSNFTYIYLFTAYNVKSVPYRIRKSHIFHFCNTSWKKCVLTFTLVAK